MTGERARVILELDGVSLSYTARRDHFQRGRHTVLDGVSLTLAEGETLGIIGRNGCGKTTILRVIAGILAPFQGDVWRRPGATCALLSLGLGFKPNLTGRDNAMLAAMLQGASARKAREYLEPIRAFSELGDSFDEPVKTYSSGMKSRLGFATAMMTRVDILLIDEVLSVGDAAFREKAQAAMEDYVAGAQSVIFVSHSAPQIRKLCDRVIWLENGAINREGDPETVLEAYQEVVGRPGTGNRQR